MEFRNLTPFSALAFDGEDTSDEPFHVVVLKVAYALLPSDSPTSTHRAEPLVGDDAAPLTLEDAYWGAPNESGVREESDLAPFKPLCDVLLTATAHAPPREDGVQGPPAPRAHWPVRLKVSKADGTSLLDKSLLVRGPRFFERRGDDWVLTEETPVTEVPLRWERAFGGVCRAGDGYHEVCYLNPVGSGWIETGYLDALDRESIPRPDRIPAPQIEHPDHATSTLIVSRHPGGDIDARAMAEAAKDYGIAPAGVGPIGRAWTPRLQRAGTYDAAWLEQRWPRLPSDFDPRHWNAAPEDQQIDYPPPDARIELHGMSPTGVLSFDLPGHRALVLWRCEDGTLFPALMAIDTLHIDAESLRLTVMWRAVLAKEDGVRAAEARFEVDPAAPLLLFRRPKKSPPRSE